jgi:hypothetical protein
MFAADRRPTVTVTSARTFEIVIDGRHYMPNYGNTVSISNLFNGSHNIQVYRLKPGFLMRSQRLVASSSFQLRNSDAQINVDRFGHVQIMQSRFGRDWNDRDRDGYGQQGDAVTINMSDVTRTDAPNLIKKRLFRLSGRFFYLPATEIHKFYFFTSSMSVAMVTSVPLSLLFSISALCSAK